MGIDIKQLWVDGASQKPRDYNYMERKFGEDWDIPFELTEEELENEEFSPMMNHFYPLPDFEDMRRFRRFTDEDIKKAVDTAGNITLVHDLIEDKYGLALTGGGMDFSWDICRGYIHLGYLPPVHFCDLPEMAGLDVTIPKNKLVIDACKRSVERTEIRSGQVMEKLNRMEAQGVL